MLRRSKTDSAQRRNGPPRLLVVEDDPDVSCLLAKVFRRSGYEVAEVGDHQVAVVTLINEPEPIDAVLASFSIGGSAACLKLLDAIRNNPDPRVAKVRTIVVLDNPRQQMFSWQSGADDVLIRPFHAVAMVQAVEFALKRSDGDRGDFRRQRIEAVKQASTRSDLMGAGYATTARFS